MFGIGSKKKEVTVEKAGSLHLMIDDNEKLTITELTINGEINGTDLLLLREMAGYTVSGRHPNGALKRLDLKNAKFVPGGQAYAKSADGDCFIEEEDVIPVRAFRKCANLQVVILPESTKEIGGHAFERCVKLSSINMPEGLLTIGSRAFRKCYEIKSITIPSTVQTIEREAFAEDEKVGKIYMMPPTPPAISVNTFYALGVNNVKLTVPAGSAEVYKKNISWKKFKAIREA